jgi:hypothetical protein
MDFCDTEVGDQYLGIAVAGSAEQQVPGRDVTMDDVVRV